MEKWGGQTVLACLLFKGILQSWRVSISTEKGAFADMGISNRAGQK